MSAPRPTSGRRSFKGCARARCHRLACRVPIRPPTMRCPRGSKAELDRAAALAPNPGEQPPLHRLNRADTRTPSAISWRSIISRESSTSPRCCRRRCELRVRQYCRRARHDADPARELSLRPRRRSARWPSAIARCRSSSIATGCRWRCPRTTASTSCRSGRGRHERPAFLPARWRIHDSAGLDVGRTTDQHQLEVAIDGSGCSCSRVGGDGGGRGRGRGGAPADGPMAPPARRPCRSVRASRPGPTSCRWRLSRRPRRSPRTC